MGKRKLEVVAPQEQTDSPSPPDFEEVTRALNQLRMHDLFLHAWHFFYFKVMVNEEFFFKISAQKDMEKDQFKKMIKDASLISGKRAKEPKKICSILDICFIYFQSCFVNSSFEIRRSTTPGTGLGVFPKKDFNPKDLWGILLPISEEEFTKLEEINYPSLFQEEKKNIYIDRSTTFHEPPL